MTFKWTNARIRQLLEGEQSDQELAEDWGISYSAVRAMQFRLRPDARRRQAEYVRRYRQKAPVDNSRNGRPWTSREDKAIMAKRRPPDYVLAQRFKRHPNAIACRRYVLNHYGPRENT